MRTRNPDANQVGFFTIFGTVIALVKDVPDVPGDRQFGILSFSVRHATCNMQHATCNILHATCKHARTCACTSYTQCTSLLCAPVARALPQPPPPPTHPPTQVQLGQQRVLRLAVALLRANLLAAATLLAAAALTAARSAAPAACARRAAVGIAALAAARMVRTEAAGVEPTDSAQVYAFYMRLWKVFYGAYFCLPFTR